MYLYHAVILNMFFKKLLFFFFYCYSISSLSDIIETKIHGFVVFQFLFATFCLKVWNVPLRSSWILLPFLSSLYIPNSWIIFFLLFVFFFQQCGHLACLTVLTCQVKQKKKSSFTPDVGFVVSVKTFHSSACPNMSKKKIERLLLSCGQ